MVEYFPRHFSSYDFCFPADIFVEVIRRNEPLWDNVLRRAWYIPSGDWRRLWLLKREAQSRWHWMSLMSFSEHRSSPTHPDDFQHYRYAFNCRHTTKIGFQSFNIWLHSFTACDVYLQLKYVVSVCRCQHITHLSSCVISSFCTFLRGYVLENLRYKCCCHSSLKRLYITHLQE